MTTSYDQITGTTSKTAPDAAGTNNPMGLIADDPISQSVTVKDGIVSDATVDAAVQLGWPGAKSDE